MTISANKMRVPDKDSCFCNFQGLLIADFRIADLPEITVSLQSAGLVLQSNNGNNQLVSTIDGFTGVTVVDACSAYSTHLADYR